MMMMMMMMKLHIHVVVNWQLFKQYNRRLVNYDHIAGDRPIDVACFFEVIRWLVTNFQRIAGWTLNGFLCNGYKFTVWSE